MSFVGLLPQPNLSETPSGWEARRLRGWRPLFYVRHYFRAGLRPRPNLQRPSGEVVWWSTSGDPQRRPPAETPCGDRTMKDGPVVATVAALIGDPARANILTVLMDGRALTVSELAEAAGATVQTTSGHLAKLAEARLVVAERQGRHRYFRLSGPDIAVVLESLMGLAQRTGAIPTRTGPRDQALRTARTCYDHLAGHLGVFLADAMQSRGHVEFIGGTGVVTRDGERFLAEFGISPAARGVRGRPLCRPCLDWSERRPHLGGRLGAALLRRFLELGWITPASGSRVVTITPEGLSGLTERFGIDLTPSLDQP